MLFIGIDISKLTFDVAILVNNKSHSKQFDNKKEGFIALLKWVNKFKLPSFFCMEATGIYSLSLAKYLIQKGHKTIVANPIQTNAFVKMEMARNKTDKADAMSISRYCHHLYQQGKIDSQLFIPKSESFEELQFLITRLDQLSKLLTQENNRLEASYSQVAKRSITSMIKLINKQTISIQESIKKIVSNDSELKKQVDLLVSIPGVGDKTAWSFLAYLGDISLFKNAKQVTSFAGIHPKIAQSGTSIHKTSLSKVGSSRLRKSLYMPALVATKHNSLLAEYYQKLLKNGKPKKVALCAVMRKLLVLCYGVLKSEKLFDLQYKG
jgi:transposase